MKPKPVLFVFFSILIFSSEANASSFFRSLRRSAAHKPSVESPQISPVPSQPMGGKRSSDSGDGIHSPGISPAPGPSVDECMFPSKMCHDNWNMTACVDPSPTASNKLLLLVKNLRNNTLKVNITSSHDKLEISIPGHQAKKVNISANIGGKSSIKLNGGNGDCIIYIGSPASSGDIFKYLPFYATNITPIYGAYLLFLTAVIIGGTWACCKLGKRERRVDGILYQEIEMGQPDSLSANDVEMAEGWNQDWGDDWDDDTNAAKSPRRRYSQSATGVTSKSSNRNGWEKEWDD